jgi:hypothetical protein
MGYTLIHIRKRAENCPPLAFPPNSFSAIGIENGRLRYQEKHNEIII